MTKDPLTHSLRGAKSPHLLRKEGNRKGRDFMVAKSKTYRIKLDDAYTAVERAIKLSSFEIKNRQNRHLTASAPVSIFSWGEDIEISLEPRGEHTKITIKSAPKAQLFDWGKSEENADRLFESLNKILASKKKVGE